MSTIHYLGPQFESEISPSVSVGPRNTKTPVVSPHSPTFPSNPSRLSLKCTVRLPRPGTGHRKHSWPSKTSSPHYNRLDTNPSTETILPTPRSSPPFQHRLSSRPSGDRTRVSRDHHRRTWSRPVTLSSERSGSEAGTDVTHDSHDVLGTVYEFSVSSGHGAIFDTTPHSLPRP